MPVDPWDSVAGLQVIEAAARSAAAGTVEAISFEGADRWSELRWGVLSTANIGVAKVIPATQAAERCRVVAIASRDPATAQAAAGRLGIPTAHGSYEALLADPEVDAVYNPLPNHLHAEWTIAAARAGKHVLCEKPLAMSSAQAQEMVDVCAAEGVTLMEAFMYRLHPSWEKVREVVASGGSGVSRPSRAGSRTTTTIPRTSATSPRTVGAR